MKVEPRQINKQKHNHLRRNYANVDRLQMFNERRPTPQKKPNNHPKVHCLLVVVKVIFKKTSISEAIVFYIKHFLSPTPKRPPSLQAPAKTMYIHIYIAQYRAIYDIINSDEIDSHFPSTCTQKSSPHTLGLPPTQ